MVLEASTDDDKCAPNGRTVAAGTQFVAVCLSALPWVLEQPPQSVSVARQLLRSLETKNRGRLGANAPERDLCVRVRVAAAPDAGMPLRTLRTDQSHHEGVVGAFATSSDGHTAVEARH